MQQGSITQCSDIDTGVHDLKSERVNPGVQSEHLLFLRVIYFAFHGYHLFFSNSCVDQMSIILVISMS